MQYTSKLAILAVALFGSSVAALPFDIDSELEVREADIELSAREVFDSYLEARDDPSFDARDLESLELEAREYFEYLEARALADSTSKDSKTQPQTPLSATSPTSHSVSANSTLNSTSTANCTETGHAHFDKMHHDSQVAKVNAARRLADPQVYQVALTHPGNSLHSYAVKKYLGKSAHMEEALANEPSPYHKAAVRMTHKQHAEVFLSRKKNYMRALKRKHSKYHKDAVAMYLSDPAHFETALANKTARFHKAAVYEYLRDPKVREAAIRDKNTRFHKAAMKMQKKWNRKHRHRRHLMSGHASPTSTSSAPTATTPAPTATSTGAA